MSPRAVIDNDLLRTLWLSDLPMWAIVDSLGYSAGTLWRQARNLGLGRRPKGTKVPRPKQAGLPPGQVLAAAAPTPAAPALPDHPFWTQDRDVLVWHTGGRHADLAALAAALARPIADVTGRWHRLRAAA